MDDTERGATRKSLRNPKKTLKASQFDRERVENAWDSGDDVIEVEPALPRTPRPNRVRGKSNPTTTTATATATAALNSTSLEACIHGKDQISTQCINVKGPAYNKAVTSTAHRTGPRHNMLKHTGILQANLGHRSEAQLSLLNDETARDLAVMLVTEPCIFDIDGKAVVHEHAMWEAVRPTQVESDRVVRSFRSLIYINKRCRFRQVEVPCSDVVAGILKFDSLELMVVSVYVPCTTDGYRSRAENRAELRHRLNLIRLARTEFERQSGKEIHLFVGGDFNRHDQAWGGDGVASTVPQGEGTPILAWMAELGLESLLPRGTSTFEHGGRETTIDLALVSNELKGTVLKCEIHEVEHGSDHRAIRTIFGAEVRIRERPRPRQNFRKTDWSAVRRDFAIKQQHTPVVASVAELERETKTIIQKVKQALNRHTPTPRWSRYMKAWWDDELTTLRDEYTTSRNRGTNARRNGVHRPDWEAHTKVALENFRTAVKEKKKRHWLTFLEDTSNVWKAARYLAPNATAFGNIPVLVDGTAEIHEDQEKGDLLLRTFFPATSVIHPNTESDQAPRGQLAEDPPLTVAEVGDAVERLRPWKAPGVDDIPNAAWQELWPVLDRWIVAIFNASLQLGHVPSPFRVARILPLRKPGKADYTRPKSYRPISLLSTLGKILELVVARRLSYWAETHGLLPNNQFGARPRRSCEQALVILVDRIRAAWRKQRVLSLVSFDVKGAYNGVPHQVLTARLKAKGIPTQVVEWVASFCTQRSATMMVNGRESDISEITYPGLPQGVVSEQHVTR
jgi:hypothetical protein